MPFRQAPPNSHQSQGSFERFHRTLFAHIRTIRIGLAINLGISPSDLPDHTSCNLGAQQIPSSSAW
eukprot:3592121-Amphidinium_carterae.1